MKKTSLLARLLCMLLALIMLMAVAVSCATEEDNEITNSTDATDSTGGEDEPGVEEIDDGLDGLDFDEALRIVASKDQAYQVFQLEEGDNVIYNAIYKRCITIEERLGVSVEYIPMDASWNDQKDIFFQHIMTTCDTGPAYDALCVYNLMPGYLASKGYLENLADTTYIDLAKPWWPEDFVEQIVVNNTLYSLVENSAYGTLRNIHGVFFNNTLLDERDLRSPYDMVANNEWTFANMMTLIKDTYIDNNENGSEEKDVDFFGLVTGTEAKIETWFYGMGYKYSNKNSAGDIEFSMNDSVYMLSWLDEFIPAAESKDFLIYDKSHTQAFFSNRAILYMTAIRMVEHGASAETKMDYGVVPVPKKDSAQEHYITNVANSHDMWCIPINVKNLDASSAVVECMAAESYKQVAPTYFDQCIKLRYAPDERLAEMYDLIRDSIVFDFCVIYSFALPQVPRTILHATAKKPTTTPWASNWEKNGPSMVTGFEGILELYR